MSVYLLWALATILAIDIVGAGLIRRWALRLPTRLFASLEMRMLTWVRLIFPPQYTLLGDCVKCGICCTEIFACPPRFIRQTRLAKLFIGYHRLFHNFHLKMRDDDGAMIFSCGHLGTDGRCQIHRWRPFICRNFPVIPWFKPPGLLPYCSYQVAHRSIAHRQSHPRLKVINAHVATHHPTPDRDQPVETQYTLVEIARPFEDRP